MAFKKVEAGRQAKMKVRVTLTEAALGMQAANPEITREFIASKAPDAASVEEEIAALGVEEYVEKTMTIFPKDETGNPFWWDYQMKGMLKDVYNMQREVKGTPSSKLWNGGKIIDGLITVSPRMIQITMPEGGKIGNCQRPLRAKTMKGDRVSLANSETVPAGSVFEFEISYDEMKPKKAKKAKDGEPAPVEEKGVSTRDWLVGLLSRAGERGFGQWRNSGAGRAVVEIDEE